MPRNIGILFVLVACPVMGQVLTQKPLSEKDYPLWGTLQTDKLSDSGSWVSYQMKYESGKDTLFVKQTKGTTIYDIAKGYTSDFKNEQYFTCLIPGKGLQILNLINGNKNLVADVISYSLPQGTDYLVLQCQSTTGSWVEIRNFDGLLMKQLNDVHKLVLSPRGNQFLCFASDGLNKVFLFDLKTMQSQMILEELNCNYTKAVWDKKGTAVAFIQTKKDSLSATPKSTVCYYSFKAHRLFSFDSNQFVNFPQDMLISSDGNVALTISDDGQRVFFGMKPIVKKDVKKTDVQVWNANDTVLYPIKYKIEGWRKIEKAAVWFPWEQKFLQITNNEQPKFVLNGTQSYAITFNPYQSKTLGSYDEVSDYYSTDLYSGTK